MKLNLFTTLTVSEKETFWLYVGGWRSPFINQLADGLCSLPVFILTGFKTVCALSLEGNQALPRAINRECWQQSVANGLADGYRNR
jgi:hypothetical protein